MHISHQEELNSTIPKVLFQMNKFPMPKACSMLTPCTLQVISNIYHLIGLVSKQHSTLFSQKKYIIYYISFFKSNLHMCKWPSLYNTLLYITP